ncbi:uncharacterized protein JN550_005050 [Neoarthrinium moseri]|uniref:uncharacterized protein n=1 Tax=Neoarthrinium moseri TaxID=1658444 RepID=UPI001FDBCC1F|nr:uncharacterized protein JN550_005050 [Neoarthrinium moseri]KAI1870507.1 hypothetical protein JN550_005050 [Neoarthrinium moseri]
MSSSPSQSQPNAGPIKAVIFDYMGTCLDWHGAVTLGLPDTIPAYQRSPLALAWRQQYFRESERRVSKGSPVEDVDTTLKRALDHVLHQDTHFRTLAIHFDARSAEEAIQSWHRQRAWAEVPAALKALRGLGCEVYMHANGSTRLQIDNTRAAGLNDGTFDLLMSSQLLGEYLPNPRAYERALELIKLRPEQVVKVAAHAYDIRGAKKAGMKTVYVKRWTDDIDVDKEEAGKEFDAVLDDMSRLPEVIARLQGCE